MACGATRELLRRLRSVNYGHTHPVPAVLSPALTSHLHVYTAGKPRAALASRTLFPASDPERRPRMLLRECALTRSRDVRD
eukprot:2541971-Rhodomonas_salina.3